MKMPYVLKLLVVPLFTSLVLALMPLQLAHAQTVRIEESHPDIVRTPGWFAVDDGSVSGGRVGVSKTPGARANLYFTGTGIKWIGYRCQCAQGYARIRLDGKVVKDIYTWGEGPQAAQVEMYSVSGLAFGQIHSLDIEVLESNGPAPYVVVDAFDIEGGNIRSPDVESPRVTLTSPVYPNNIVTGRVTLTADATDNIDVTRVEFYAGTTLIGFDSTAPYSFTRDTSGIPSGSTYSISAVAYDAAGNSRRSARSDVTVQHEDGTRPQVAITSPIAGSTLSGTIEITAAGSDASGIAQVKLHLDTVELGTDTSAPFTVSSDTTTWLDGKHQLGAQAIDGAGNTGDAQPITINVNNALQPGMVRVHDDDPLITYTGQWNLQTGGSAAGPVFHWDSARVAKTAGATASITFEGTGIRWIGVLCDRCGAATVSIDGAPPQRIPLYSDTGISDRGQRAQVVYASPVLAFGTHTLTLVVQEPTIRPTQTEDLVYVDAFEILK
ncbi:MAG: Ig-like domain-containing protein [Pseudomonadota bacterium]